MSTMTERKLQVAYDAINDMLDELEVIREEDDVAVEMRSSVRESLDKAIEKGMNALTVIKEMPYR
jgi:hypothetical protein